MGSATDTLHGSLPTGAAKDISSIPLAAIMNLLAASACTYQGPELYSTAGIDCARKAHQGQHTRA